MDQINKMYTSMSAFQRVSIVVVIMAGVVACTYIANWRHDTNFKVLYRGLAAEDAAVAVQKLKEAGVEYKLEEDGNTILVPTEKANESRLLLARDGLPKTGRIGFELFDRTNFSTTDFAEQVNYRRALEGELERTISSLGEIEKARVHLTFPKESVYTENRQPAKASVLLNLRRSSALSLANVTAISNLVASAVDGLQPQQVTIVDAHGDLLNKPRGNDSLSTASDTQFEYQMNLEHELSKKLNDTLDPVLGPGNYRAGVAVECDFSGIDENEEVLDPTKSVILTSQRTDETTAGRANAGGVPGTAANSPDPPPGTLQPGGTTRRTESTNYQTSKVTRHIEHQRGAVKRVTVSVLLDQQMKWEKQGADYTRTFLAPPPEKINVIKTLVSNIAGINTARGDQVTVDTLPFDGSIREDRPEQPGQSAQPTQPGQKNAPATAAKKPWYMQRDPKVLGGAGGGAVVLIGTIIWLARRKRRAPRFDMTETVTSFAPAAPRLLSVDAPPHNPAMPTAPAAQQVAAQQVGQQPEPNSEEQKLIDSLKAPMLSATKSETLTKYLRQEVHKDPGAATQLLRTWILDEEN